MAFDGREARIRRALMAAGLGCLATAGWLARDRYHRETYWPAAVFTLNERYDLPLIVAHKAGGVGAPPGTLEAVYEHLRGEAGGLELDVRVSADGVPLIFHDDLLERLTNCSGSVEAKNWAELKGCRYGEKGKAGKSGLASLEDVLKAVAGRKLLFLDAKEHGVKDAGLGAAVLEAIGRQDAFHYTIVESFNPFFLLRMRRRDPRIRLMFDFADEAKAVGEEDPAQLARIPWLLKQDWFRWIVRELVRPDFLGPRYSVRPETLRRLAGMGYPLVAWTVDDAQTALRLFASGVGSVQTNAPVLMAKALKSSRLRRIDDASGSNSTLVLDVARPLSVAEVQAAFRRARESGLRVSIAGRRHSMGSHSFGPGQLVLDMTGMRRVSLDAATGLVVAEAGATWLDVQRALDPRGRSVQVMQSDNIFTVGGSLSVNAHGWQTGSAPIAATVEDFVLVTPNGEVKTCSRTAHADLFRAALGGYGAFGAIVSARLRTVPNELYQKKSWSFGGGELASRWKALVIDNRKARLAYGRLSIDSRHFLTEASIHVYEPVEPQPRVLPAMSQESLVRLKWRVFRASERSDIGKYQRWLLERHLGSALEARPETRNTVMGPDVHVLWPERADKRDILQEYFVPLDRLERFIAAMGKSVRRSGQNLLNVTLRDVRRDSDSLLCYSSGDRVAVVLFFSQDASVGAEASMRALTGDLIEEALALGGSFYLPYRLHYTREQFRRGYPAWKEFSRLRRRADPDRIIWSGFLEHIGA